MDLTAVYQASLEKWGAEGQYDQAMEECAELITALLHFRRGKATAQEVVAELADVRLMLGQLSWMFGEAAVDAAVQDKLAKLAGLLDEASGE